MSNEDKCILLNKLLKEGFLCHPYYDIINVEIIHSTFILTITTKPPFNNTMRNNVIKLQNILCNILNITILQEIIEFDNGVITRY